MLSLLSSLLVSLCLLLSVLLPAARAASCSNLSVVEIGPYFVDLRLNTPYIAVNVSAGVVLNLTILVLDGRTSSTQCVPLVGAMVDTWSTLWNGKYSDESAEATQSLIYLRGFQLSNSSGYVQFNSRYPGQRTAHSAQRTAHSAQRTAHSAQRTTHSAQRTAHSTRTHHTAPTLLHTQPKWPPPRA